MDTDNHPTPTFSYLKDAVAFFVTVAACTFFLTAAYTLAKTTETIVDTSLVLAMPQPPAPLELAPEPESALLRIEVVFALPEVEMAFALPGIEVVFALSEVEVASAGADTTSELLSPPDGVVPPKPIPFHGIIVQVAGRYEVDPHLIRAIIFAESGYNPRAKSKKGARGLMQLMPSTAKSLGVEDIYDPEENIDGGVRYFRSLLDRFDGDVQLALAAYNAGSRHVRNYEGIPPFKATKRYIQKVLKFHEKFKMENAADSRRLA